MANALPFQFSLDSPIKDGDMVKYNGQSYYAKLNGPCVVYLFDTLEDFMKGQNRVYCVARKRVIKLINEDECIYKNSNGFVRHIDAESNKILRGPGLSISEEQECIRCMKTFHCNNYKTL
jgi:hypothetical protein